MALFDNILESLVGGEEPEQMYRYACNICGTSFESKVRGESQVTCPECGTTDHQHISRLRSRQ